MWTLNMRIIPLLQLPWPHRTPGALCLKHEQPQPTGLPHWQHTTHFVCISILQLLCCMCNIKSRSMQYLMAACVQTPLTWAPWPNPLAIIMYCNTLALYLASSTQLAWTILYTRTQGTGAAVLQKDECVLSTAHQLSSSVRAKNTLELGPNTDPGSPELIQAPFPQRENKNYLSP